MTAAEVRPAPPPALQQITGQVLCCLYQHRILSTRQLRRLVTPDAARATYLRRILRSARDAGYLDAVNIRQGERLWYLTTVGYGIAEAAGELTRRTHRMTAELAHGRLQSHQLAVADAGIAFVEHARDRGDECGPLDWAPEVWHPVRDGGVADREGDHLIADAVLHYTVHRPSGGRGHLTLFLELDRSTYSVPKLTDKLLTYARYYRYRPGSDHTPPSRRGHPAATPKPTPPAWQHLYPRFPRLLVVLADTTPAAAASRIAALRGYCAALLPLRSLAGELLIGATTLDELSEAGPFAHIFTPILGDDDTRTDVYLGVRRGGG